MSIYYAVEFDEQTMKRLFLKQLEVKQNSIQGDFVQPETFHITVLFCAGDGTGYSRTDYKNALDELGKKYTPKQFQIKLENFGQFKNNDNGSVVWVGVRDSFPLYELKKNLEQTLHDMNVHIEKTQFKGYTPHITMGYDVILKDNFNTNFIDNEPVTIKSIVLWDSFKSGKNGKESYVYNKIHELYFK